jgi:hypothetical protein
MKLAMRHQISGSARGPPVQPHRKLSTPGECLPFVEDMLSNRGMHPKYGAAIEQNNGEKCDTLIVVHFEDVELVPLIQQTQRFCQPHGLP